jgi:hypothetical protein
MKKYVEKKFYDENGNEVTGYEKVDCSFKEKFFAPSTESTDVKAKVIKFAKGVGIVALGTVAVLGIMAVASAGADAEKEIDELTEDPTKLLDDEPKPEKDVADQIIEKELGLDSVETKVLKEV